MSDEKVLKCLRLAKGWTQRELAREAGISRWVLNQFEGPGLSARPERGPYSIRPYTAGRLAQVLGVKVGDICDTQEGRLLPRYQKGN